MNCLKNTTSEIYTLQEETVKAYKITGMENEKKRIVRGVLVVM